MFKSTNDFFSVDTYSILCHNPIKTIDNEKELQTQRRINGWLFFKVTS